jgi:hypothetical protein
MFDLPSIDVDDTVRLADWVELCVFFGDSGVMSQADMADVVHDAGLLGGMPEDVLSDDASFRQEEEDFSSDDATERLAGAVWEHLETRSRGLKEGYPFAVEGDKLRLKVPSWRAAPAFAMLLVADISRVYELNAQIEPDSESGRLFEKVVEASQRGLLRGTAVRFGWPIEPGWPTPIDDRIGTLGERLGLGVERLTGKTRPQDKDRGLDVVARFSGGDDGPATFVLLTQCATGKHWKKKRGEPAISDWRDILRWDAQLLRAVAIPWRLDARIDRGFHYVRTYRHFDAVILDRPRLVAGTPDRFLADDVKDQIVRWCEKQVVKLPSLS